MSSARLILSNRTLAGGGIYPKVCMKPSAKILIVLNTFVRTLLLLWYD